MAHKKAAGSTRLGRDSRGQRLGVKIFGDQHAKAGNIILRQRGTKFTPGENVMLAKDFSIHALIDGVVEFKQVMTRRFTGKLEKTRLVSIRPLEAVKASASKSRSTK